MIGITPMTGLAMEATALVGHSMRTKELCEKTGVSEATLRRWLREGTVPDLADVPEDWRGWRKWEDRHVDAIRRYQEQKKQKRKSTGGLEPSPQLNLPLNARS